MFTLPLFSQKKVGINTLDPKATLDVNGNVIISKTPNTVINDIDDVLVLDPTLNVIESVEKFSITGVEEVKKRIIVLAAKNLNQKFSKINTNYDVIFDSSLIQGLNADQVKLDDSRTIFTFPANKIIEIIGYIGIRGKNSSSSKNYPAYITSKFEAVGDGVDIIYSTLGYVESSTMENTDSGGVTNPSVLFITGPRGGSIKLVAQYGGVNADIGTNGVADDTGYLMAGKPTSISVGTYLTIEEL